MEPEVLKSEFTSVNSTLLQELRDLIFQASDVATERYDFTWTGKTRAFLEAGLPVSKTLRPNVDSSREFNTTKNIFITGDNLDTLKLLQENYLNEIDVIYLDPPYNTGKNFVYRDKFSKSVEEYIDDSRDDDGERQYTVNSKDSGRFHSDWLSMMYPRLRIARNLLNPNGVIFVSIDDNELANLKLLMDEVFDENNFIDIFSWQKTTTPANLSKTTKKSVEYVLAYSGGGDVQLQGLVKYSSSSNGLMNQTNKVGELIFPAEITRTKLRDGVYNAGTYGTKSYEINLLDDTEVKDGHFIKPVRLSGKFKWSQDYLDESIANGVKIYIQTEAFSPSYEKEEYDPEKPWNIINGTFGVGTNENAGDELDKLFEPNFSDDLWPKPTSLLMYLINMIPNKSARVLDVFAGTGTTAEAVMKLNSGDGGDRTWIIGTLNEKTSQTSEARKAGFETIDEIAKERIRRSGDILKRENTEIDTGFRSFEVASTSIKEDIFKTAGETQQSALFDSIENIKTDRNDLDLIFETLVNSGLKYNMPLTEVDFADSTIYQYDYFGEMSGVVFSLSNNTGDDFIQKIASLKPLVAVFRESAFKDSANKVNIMEIFRITSPDTKVKVI